jgi:general secretion pathway protein N
MKSLYFKGPFKESFKGKWACLCGLALGATIALLSQWPAAWVTPWIASATQGHLQLVQTQGSVWHGSGQWLLSAGQGSSQTAVRLPARWSWDVSGVRKGWPWEWGLQIHIKTAENEMTSAQDTLVFQWMPWKGEGQGAWRRVTWLSGQLGWPLRSLAALGAPWNTLQLDGWLQLQCVPTCQLQLQLQLEKTGQEWQFSGHLQADILGVSSGLSPLKPLGSYRLTAQPASGQPSLVNLQLDTLDGVLRLTGQGQVQTPAQTQGIHGYLKGQAQAAQTQWESPLSGVLAVIGQKQASGAAFSLSF